MAQESFGEGVFTLRAAGSPPVEGGSERPPHTAREPCCIDVHTYCLAVFDSQVGEWVRLSGPVWADDRSVHSPLTASHRQRSSGVTVASASP